MGQNIFLQWILFQFFDVPKEILKAWRNFLKFNLNYFSIKVLFRTLFAYWHQFQWQAPKGFYPGQWFEAEAGNLISRILGALIRIFMIVLGIVVEILILAAGTAVFLVWLALPFVLCWGLIFGISRIL